MWTIQRSSKSLSTKSVKIHITIPKRIDIFRNLSFIAVLSDEPSTAVTADWAVTHIYTLLNPICDGKCNETSVTFSRSVKWEYQTSSLERQTLLLWQQTQLPSQNCSLLKEKPTLKKWKLMNYKLSGFFQTHMSFFYGTQNE